MISEILPIGLSCGYGFGAFIGGETEGVQGRLHWEFFLNTTKIHLHHWIVMSFVLIIYLTFIEPCYKTYNQLIIGFLLGGIIHGLSYTDRFKIIG